jgi:hypothetical protein
MVTSEEVLNFNFYTYKEAFTGSDKGMRYRLIMLPKGKKENEEDLLEVCVWPEPFAEAFTEEEKKSYNTFPFTEEGKEEAVKWINEQHVRFE